MKKQFLSKSVPRGTRTIWRYLGALFILFTFAIGNVWAAASTTTDGKYATGTIDFSTIGTLSGATTYWHNGVKFYSGNATSISANNTAWSTSVSIPAYVSNVTAGKDANKCKWGNGGTAKQYTQSGFACSQHTIGIHVNQACTLTIVVNKNVGSDTDDAGISASIDDVAYGTAYTSSTYKAAGSTALTVTSARADKTNASGRYTLTIVVGSGDLKNGEAVVKMFNGSSGSGAGKLFCWESITVTPAATPTAHTVTYKSGDGSGDDVVDDDATVVGGCPSTFSYTGYDFAGWKDGDNNDVEVGDVVSSDMTLTAQWTVHVAKYTVKYMDGSTVLDTEEVNVTEHPAGLAENPKKDCYTFAAWSPALSSVSGEENDEVEVNATWTPKYASSADFTTDPVKTDKPNVNTYLNGLNYITKITFDASKYEYTNNETKKGFYGYKIGTENDSIKFLVQQGKQVKVLFGSINADPTIKVNGAAASLDAARQKGDNVENTFTYSASSADAIVLFKFGSGTTTLKKIDIYSLYNATYTDGTGDASGSASNVAEVTLPTPTETTVGTSTFIGWTANKVVYDGETAKAVGAALEAGKTYKLTDNTVFTAQWAAVTDFDVKFFQGYGEPDVQIGTTQVISTGEYATAPTDPERAGFAFLGWSYDATEAHIVDVATYGITAETNFTAMWKQVWTVTFDGAGAVNVEDGKKVASPNSPVTAGKVFLGWYNGDNKYDFSANVTANMALTSKWEDANANHFYYNYKDDFHYDGVVYKSPEGKVDNKDGESNKAITTPYTLFSGSEGITSVVATKAIYDSKSNWVNAYLKINTSEDSYLTFTIKAGYTAVLKMKMGGYSANPTVTLKKGEDVIAATSGSPAGKYATTENDFNEVTYNLVAGTYTMTTATKTVYISHIDLEATVLPTYAVTYLAGEGSVKEGQSIPTQEAVEAGTVITLASGDALEKSGYVFNGWLCNIDSEVKNPSAEYTMTAAATTFTAQWLEDNGMAKLYRSDDTPDAGNPYTTLVAAVAAAQDGDKIVLQRNVLDGAGIMLTKDDHKTITIDFNTYTYTAVTPGVGSAGTQNQAFHLEKNNTVTLKNGTITSSGSEIKMLIQNYCDLTLENIILDGSNLEGSHRYVLSNNCGDVVIGSGTEITAKTGDVAFDVCATNYYPEGVTVTVQDGATISGIVEYDVWGTKPVNNQATLAIEGGEFDITWNVESALAEDAKENLNVSAGSFSEAVPVEYCAAGYIPAPQDPVTNKYTVKEGWKVTFVDGEDVEIVPVDKNTPVAEKAVAGKIGYAFDGWYNGADLYDFAANVTADLTLNAHWTAFEGCTELWPATSGDALSVGDIVDLQTGSKGGSIKVANLGAAGSIAYNANGLSFSNGGKDSVLVTLNNDLKNGSVIKVRLMANGGTKDNGRGLNLLNAARVKKALLGWQANEEVALGDVREFTYTVVESDGFAGTNVFTLQRQNSVFLQSIKVEECGDAIVYHNVTSEVNIAGKGTVTLGASSVREGYTTTATYSDIDPLYEFVSWSVSGEGASVDNATANPATITVGTEDAVVTLNLQLIPVKFTVNYYDGETPMGTELVAVNENPTASEINTNKRHFTFQGWSETNGGSVVDLNTITSDVAATIDLYAVYAPVACPTEGVVFSMEFDNTKAPESTVKVAKNGGSIDLANYATLVGGAAVINNTETSDKDAISTDGKFLLKATKEVMKIELDCAIATGDVIRIPDNNAKYVLSTSDSKTGTYQERTSSQHEFEATAAWNGVDDLYILYDGSSLNFTKVYVLRPYTVSFDLQGHGDAIDAQKLVEGKKVEEPTAPTADGWDFIGWYKEAACTNAWDFDNDVVDGTMSLFAKWTEHVTNDATLKSLKYGSTAITLVDGTYEYNVELAAAVAAVPALSAETNAALATKEITNATEFVAGQASSTVLVTAEDGATQLLYTVNFTKEAALPQVNVTEATVWNFATAVAGSTSMENLTDVVLANVPGITNDATFNSQALKGTFNKMPGNYFQGSKLSFTTEVDGMLRVIFRGTNNNSRHLQVCVGEGEEVIADWDYKGSGDSAEKDSAIYVPAGKVTLKAFEGNSANNARIYRMELVTADNYHRTVNPSFLGTLCWTNNAVLGGATLYEFAGKDEYNKLVFDEVAENRLEAGKPYIFMPENGNTEIKLYNTDNEAALTEDQEPVNHMYGTITGKTLVPGVDDNMYYFSSNHIWAVKDFVVNIAVPAYYCYVDYPAVLADQPAPAAPAPGRRRVTMGVQGEQVVTGVENLNASEQPVKLLINGQIFILRGEKLFDATGRLVK